MTLKSYVMYTTPTCHYCALLKDWLNQHQIPFEVKDVSGDIQARQEMVMKSQQMAVPVSVIVTSPTGNDQNLQETVIVGFDQRRLSALFGL